MLKDEEERIRLLTMRLEKGGGGGRFGFAVGLRGVGDYSEDEGCGRRRGGGRQGMVESR